MNILICVGVCEGAGSSFTKHDSKCLCPAVPSKAHFTVNFIFTQTHTHTHSHTHTDIQPRHNLLSGYLVLVIFCSLI